MLMQEPTPQMVAAWKTIFEEYQTQLRPNLKSALEVITYLQHKYTLTESTAEEFKQVVVDHVLQNKHYVEKLPGGKIPIARVFFMEDTGAGKLLYAKQDDLFKGNKIIVGVELETAFFMVEGSSLLWDEVFAFRGLDADDLHNFYLVAEYITCLKKFDLLNLVLTKR